jgi:hypothetical protein
MKKTIFAVALCLTTTVVHAIPVHYEFAGSHLGEYNTDFSAASDYLFADGTSVNISFFYDNNTPATLTNVADGGDLQPFGLLSIYGGSTSNFVGNVDGQGFSAATGTTIVGNSNAGDTTFLDGVFNVAGNLNGNEVGTGFAGFDINGYSLKSLNIFYAGFMDLLSDQSLPPELSSPTPGLYLIFADANNNERIVNFAGSVLQKVPTPVSEPSSLVLLAGGLFGLAAFRHRRKA